MAQVMTKVQPVKGNLVNVLRLSDLCDFEEHHSTIPLNLNKNAKFMFIASGDDQNYDMKRNVSTNFLLAFVRQGRTTHGGEQVGGHTQIK